MTEVNLLKLSFGEIYYMDPALDFSSCVCYSKDAAFQIKVAFRTEE